MTIQDVDRRDSGLFSDIANCLVYDQEKLSGLIRAPFSLKEFKTQIDLKKGGFHSERRKDLHQVMTHQYANISMNELVQRNIDSLLDENTFTITTGHQLSIFTGPLFFIYKILHVIKMTEELKKEYPKNNFVPIFWMASEDHDLAEIQKINLFSKEFIWETDQSGAVGRMEVSSLMNLKDEILKLFSQHEKSEVEEILNQYKGENLSDATFSLVNALFSKFGLIILDADSAKLKASLGDVFEKEIRTSFAEKSVQDQTGLLENLGFEGQAHPRPINFFFLSESGRERIITVINGYEAGDKKWSSREEILQDFRNNPASFSPNVILRPLYQEIILPNLCYVGGGGEMAYWLQLKAVFDEVKVPFPLIQVRNSVLLLEKPVRKKMDQLNWSVNQIFEDEHALKKALVMEEGELDFNELNQALKRLVETLKKTIETVDNNLKSYGAAEITRLEKQIDGIQQKLIRTEKNKHQQLLDNVDFIKNKLFGGGLQERSLNFFQLCADGEVNKHLNLLYETIDPFNPDLRVVEW